MDRNVITLLVTGLSVKFQMMIFYLILSSDSNLEVILIRNFKGITITAEYRLDAKHHCLFCNTRP